MTTRAKEQEGNDMLSAKKLAAWVLCAFVTSATAFGGTPNVLVSGTVTDGSGHGWPLYARVEFTSASSTPIRSPASTRPTFRAGRRTRWW